MHRAPFCGQLHKCLEDVALQSHHIFQWNLCPVCQNQAPLQFSELFQSAGGGQVSPAVLLFVPLEPSDGELRPFVHVPSSTACLRSNSALVSSSNSIFCSVSRAVSAMAAPWPLRAAKGLKIAARSRMGIRGCRLEVGCGRFMMSSYGPLMPDALRSFGCALWPWRHPPGSSP